MREAQTDILIVGAGLGGVAGALAALKLGKRVILTEETGWIGGQLTSQAVPPDEHPWIESHGCTASYREFRERVRGWYRRNYPLLPEHRANPRFNLGGGYVSALCHEPRAALAVLHDMLAPWLASGRLTLWEETIPVAAETDGDRVRSVTHRHRDGEETVVSAPYVLDATELGDLLELANVEHVIGTESQAQTGELHAPAEANPLDQQAISWCFAVDHLEGEDHTIDKPERYDFWANYHADFWPERQFSWFDVHPVTLEKRYLPIFRKAEAGDKVPRDFWHYRRILDHAKYPAGTFVSDITLVNWPQIDYWLGPIVGVTDEKRNQHLEGARQLSLSFLYWMQTAAPRLDGVTGYRGLRLRSDVTGTTHGLAKAVYVRESRRIAAEFTALEGHVGVEQRPQGPAIFPDSVGVGSYRIDLHPSTALRTYVDISSWSFQIPLGALIPRRVENLLPANKNLGTTHITNGCYRLHPVEWNIGEAAGALAAWSLLAGESPRGIRNTASRLADFQSALTSRLGFELEWPSIRPR